MTGLASHLALVILSLSSEVGIAGGPLVLLSIYVGSGNLSSLPLTLAQQTLPTEASPQPLLPPCQF